MDDFSISSLHESKNEWGSRLLTILTPLINEGLKSIFDEALKLCKENNELDKYLMTFQNFISRIPKWNANIIEIERKRIIERSACEYLEDLITCVHIIQLKLLTAMRAGQKQKKIDINIPKLDDFIHKVYINVARKIYKNVYLFEINIAPLQVQKNHRELEIIVQECILTTIRDSIPVETILRAYMDESVEEDVIEEIKEQLIDDPNAVKPVTAAGTANAVPTPAHIVSEQPPYSPSVVETFATTSMPNLEPEDLSSKLSFNNVDFVRNEFNEEHEVDASKDYERLEQISNIRNAERKRLESEDDDYGGGSSTGQNVRLNITDQNIQLNNLDIHDIDPPDISLMPDLLFDVEVLE
uniref:Uncharacterized protein n=1 Tax=viral metagenome TaxID=1070528 RepID=A0A6C0EV04_9ZZZZ